MFAISQAILGRVSYINGENPDKDRVYLVVDVFSDGIEILDVSSVKGKEHKLFFTSNKEIKNYNPPFLKQSFVKLDTLRKIPIAQAGSLRLLAKGKVLDGNEMSIIQDSLKEFYKHIKNDNSADSK